LEKRREAKGNISLLHPWEINSKLKISE